MSTVDYVILGSYLLFLLTLCVTFPSLYVFSALFGSRLRADVSLRLLLLAVAVNLAVLASFGPVTAFFTLSTESYPFIVLLNVVLFAIAGFIALGFLRRAIAVVFDAGPAAEPPTTAAAATAAPTSAAAAPSEAEQRMENEQLRLIRRAGVVLALGTLALAVWLLLWYAIEFVLLVFAGVLLAIMLDVFASLTERHVPLSHRWALAAVIVFLLSVAYNTGVTLLESGLFLVVFIVIMVVLMITGWRRQDPTI